MRTRNYSPRTITTYIQLIKRFILFNNKTRPADGGENGRELSATIRQSAAAELQQTPYFFQMFYILLLTYFSHCVILPLKWEKIHMATYQSKTDPPALSPVMTTHATAKGQIVIPVKLRRKYHIEAGTTIRVIDEGDRIVLRPITRELIYSLYGKYKDYDLLKALAEEKKYEREL